MTHSINGQPLPVIEADSRDVVQVVLLGAMLPQFQQWLHARGLFMFKMPLGDDVDDLPTYGIAPSDQLFGRSG